MLRVDLFEEVPLELVHKDGKASVRQRSQEECVRQKEGDVQRPWSVKESRASEKQTEGRCGWRVVKGRENIKRFPGKRRRGP